MNMFCVCRMLYIIYFYIKVLASFTTIASSQMPKSWNGFCESVGLITDKLYKIHCRVANENAWDFIDYRNWANTLKNSKVELVVRCEREAVISLPWPYRAPYLESLSVYGCTIINYGSEARRLDIFNITDSLRMIDITNCSIEINVNNYLSLESKHFEPEYECGPVNVEKYVFRNVTFSIKGLESLAGNKSSHLNITEKLSARISNAVHLEHICDMKNLKLMDLSQQRHSSPFKLENSFINSRYPKLEVLNLSHSDLNEIPVILSTWRRRLVKLRILDLSFNAITHFNFRGLSTSRSTFGRINLTHNNIQTVAETEMASFLRVKRVLIDIRYNPFLCDCALLNFTKFLHKYQNPEAARLDPKYIYLWQLKCSAPAKHKNVMISSLTSQDICAKDVFYTIGLAILSGTVVLLIFLIYLISRFREEIRILAFTRLRILLPCHQAENTKLSKQYDAFVSYSSLDTEWVVQTLLPRLENPTSGPRFHVCLHQRDFAVGGAIAENIVESIESSRHTILVLSKNFLKSEWCVMEFRTAFHQSLLDKTKHLIPVLLENVPAEEMDADLRSYLKTVTYIKVNDRLFWDRVIFALTDRRTDQQGNMTNSLSQRWRNKKSNRITSQSD